MNFHVRLQNNLATEIVESDETLTQQKSRHHPSLKWVAGDADTRGGHIYDPATKTFSPLVPALEANS